MVICTMMRMLLGMTPRMRLIAAPANAATLVSAAHISRVGSSDVVTASAEQIPSICRVTGLLSISGLRRTVFASSAIGQPPSRMRAR